jgi:4-hydroxy-tetrahydrodipicolinate reductase
MLKILHVGLGPLGKMMVADMARRGIARVVEAVDIDPAVVGNKLSAVVPECGFDCTVKPSIAEAVGTGGGRFDAALLTTSSDLAKCMGSLRELLAMGLPVVSTCEELLFPWLRHKPLAEELQRLAVRHGGRVLGTGVNPGFLMDTLPVAATAVCRSVKGVKVWRIQDATPRRIPFQKKIGAGLDDAGFAARIKDGSLRHVGLGESVHFVAHYLGLKIDTWDETIEAVKADRDLNAAIGPIRRGQAAGVRQVARAWTPGAGPGDAPVIQMEFQAAIGQSDPHDRVHIDGEPPIDLVLRGGVHGDVATCAITLNAVPALIAVGPGLHTMATVPLVRCLPRG